MPSKKGIDKIHKFAGATSTKQIEGIRKGGVLYVSKGVGTGCFSNINPSSSVLDDNNSPKIN